MAMCLIRIRLDEFDEQRKRERERGEICLRKRNHERKCETTSKVQSGEQCRLQIERFLHALLRFLGGLLGFAGELVDLFLRLIGKISGVLGSEANRF